MRADPHAHTLLPHAYTKVAASLEATSFPEMKQGFILLCSSVFPPTPHFLSFSQSFIL